MGSALRNRKRHTPQVFPPRLCLKPRKGGVSHFIPSHALLGWVPPGQQRSPGRGQAAGLLQAGTGGGIVAAYSRRDDLPNRSIDVSRSESAAVLEPPSEFV